MTDDEIEAWRARQEAKSQRSRYFTSLESAAAQSQLSPRARAKAKAPKRAVASTQIRPTHTPAPGPRAGRAENCASCGCGLRPKRALAADYPGTVKNFKRGMCKTCYMREAPVRITPCSVCGRPTRPSGTPLELAPGSVLERNGTGMCLSDYRAANGGRVGTRRK